MDHDNLKKLIDLMNANDLLELEVVEEGSKIRLKKMYEGGARIVQVPMAGAVSAAPVAAAPGAAPAATKAAAPSNRLLVKSPMVGTFYRSSSPDQPAYVNPGDSVGVESVVCIIEAMKVFNEIRAEVEGTIAEILVQNGEAVEYGQPLFAVDPI